MPPVDRFAVDWSELSGAVIAPGETLDFVFKTFTFADDAAIGVGGRDPSWETGIGIGFCCGPIGPFGQLSGPGWRDTILPPIGMSLGDTFALGPLQSAALETLGYGALGSAIVLVPEPGTALLLGIGLVLIARRRSLR